MRSGRDERLLGVFERADPPAPAIKQRTSADTRNWSKKPVKDPLSPLNDEVFFGGDPH